MLTMEAYRLPILHSLSILCCLKSKVVPNGQLRVALSDDQKTGKNVRLPPDTLCCLIRIRIREIDFSTEEMGSQWALGSCAMSKNVHSKDDAWHLQKKQK